MVFSSILFIFIFLPLFLGAYYLTPQKWRNYTALIGSLFFYAWGTPRFALVLCVTSIIDYVISTYMHATHSQRKKQWLLASALCINIALLLYFKYANFFVAEVNHLIALFGKNEFVWGKVVLPIGISFFTFQKISYLVDVYRGEVAPARRMSDFLLYVVLFPQLIAGPIVRYSHVAAQIVSRTYTIERFYSGIIRFCIGLAKKVLIADQVGRIADIVFSLAPENMYVSYVWIGILAYSVQILFDFSGYSDMAIGLGRMLGFEFRENFNQPYIAKSFTDFWRRWHISLSDWMKNYLYIPLGGNRVSKIRMYANLWIVFILSGLWHGASWTFVLWGIYHGFFLVLDKVFWLKKLEKVPAIISMCSTYIFLLFGWVLFRSDTAERAYQYSIHLLHVGALHSAPEILWAEIVSNRALAMLVIGLFLSFFPATKLYRNLSLWWRAQRSQKNVFISIEGLSVLILFVISVMSLLNSGFHPFIYFRF